MYFIIIHKFNLMLVTLFNIINEIKFVDVKNLIKYYPKGIKED